MRNYQTTLQVLKSVQRCSAGLFRVAIVLLFVASTIAALSIRAAVARADDGMMTLGRHLIAMSETGMGRNGRGVYINGQQLEFRVFVVDQELPVVLDFYESWCRGGTGTFRSQEEELSGGLLLSPEKRLYGQLHSQEGLRAGHDTNPGSISLDGDRSWTDLTHQYLEGDMGYVTCLKHGLSNPSSETLADRAIEFIQSGNLADLGQFHYTTATRVGNRTRVVAVWTEGDFYPISMFPETGDAPGFGIDGIGRPPSGRRMLSAGETGNSETLTVYIECEESVDELSEFYRRDLAKQEWRVLLDEREEEQQLFVVQRDGEMRVISLTTNQGKRSVTIATAD